MTAAWSRRTVLVGGSTSVAFTLASCRGDGRQPSGSDRSTSPTAGAEQASAEQGRLAFRRPPAPRDTAAERRGRFEIGGAPGSEPALLYVPPVDGGEPLRLVVMLHGAGGVARSAIERLREEAERHRLLLLAPKSTAATWDVIAGGYGPDVRNIDKLLTDVAGVYPVRGYTIGGFSDGASYALSLGLANGDVFDSVIAFSPGFEAAAQFHGRPRLFISHGTEDQVLPIDRCSRRIVPELEGAGYDVTYVEFDGGHAVPDPVQDRAVQWLRRVGRSTGEGG